MNSVVFVDYDNLSPIQKATGILSIVTSALLQMPWRDDLGRGTCDIRIYGGWYEESDLTRKAQELTVEIEKEFPAVISISGKSNALVATAKLAVALLEDPSHHMIGTFRQKGKPNNVRVRAPTDVGCTDSSCCLLDMKSLLRKGKCPKPGCELSDKDLLYRIEQKLVDTMLACDIVYATSLIYDEIIVISGDDDFLPPIRTAIMRGATVARFHPRAPRNIIPIVIGTNKVYERAL